MRRPIVAVYWALVTMVAASGSLVKVTWVKAGSRVAREPVPPKAVSLYLD